MRWLICLTMTFIFLGCKSSKQMVLVAEDNAKNQHDEPYQPDWVKNKPISISEYHGVGNATLRDPNYQKTAKMEALDDLASEIRISIQSSSILNQIENNSSFIEYYKSSILGQTKQELQEYELVDSWTDNQFYWVYYKLNKQKFKEWNDSKKDKAIQLAKGNFLEAIHLEQNGEFIHSLQLYAQVLEDLKLYLNESNEVIINGETIFIAQEALKKIRQLISDIRITSDQSKIMLINDDNHELVIRASISNKMAKNLPIIISTESEERKIINSDGVATVYLNRKSLVKEVNIRVSLDFLKSYEIASHMIRDLPISNLTILVSSKPLTFFIETHEVNMGRELPTKMLLPFISKIIVETGATVSSINYDYVLKVNGLTQKGSELEGLHSAYLDIFLSVYNNQNDMVYQDSFLQIKGIHSSYERAGLKAYQSLQKEVETLVAKSLKENFFQLNKSN